MNAQIAKPKEDLAFTKVKSNRSTAFGVLTDSKGNTFSIEIKGTDKKNVEKFINYERRQAKKGNGIKVKVKPVTGKPPYLDANAATTRGKVRPFRRGVSIKINGLVVKRKPPYILSFIIDPPIENGQVRDFPFDNQPTADVKCNVSKGSVKVELFEFVDSVKANTVLVASDTAAPGQPKLFTNIAKQYSGNWNFRVTGQDSSNFSVELDLFVP